MSINVSLKFVPKGPINDIPSLEGNKPLSEPMLVSWLTHIRVTQPQSVKCQRVIFLYHFKKQTAHSNCESITIEIWGNKTKCYKSKEYCFTSCCIRFKFRIFIVMILFQDFQLFSQVILRTAPFQWARKSWIWYGQLYVSRCMRT